MVTITISGSPGSGKTTVARLLGKKLGMKHVYTGDIFRDMAKKYKMTLQEFGQYCEQHEKVDKELDQHQLEILQQGEVILEGRIAGWIAHLNKIPALKVLIDAELDIRAERIVKREKGDFNKRKQEIVMREKSESTRYKQYYNIDLGDTSIYDLIIDSSYQPPERIVDRILQAMQL